MTTTEDGWERYGGTLTRAMAEVLPEFPDEVFPEFPDEVFPEFPDEVRPQALEVAGYWISLGLAPRAGASAPGTAAVGVDRGRRGRANRSRRGRASVHRGGPRMRRRGLVSNLYRAARLANDVSVLTSGKPNRIARRAKNRIVARAMTRSGLRRLLWGH